jgi:hypothetical protein
MKKNELVGKTFSLDLGQQAPVEYLKSWAGRNEEFNVDDFAKLACLKIEEIK